MKIFDFQNIREKKDGAIQVFILIPFIIFFLLLIYEIFTIRYTLSVFIADFKTNVDMANFATYKYISQRELSQSGQIVIESSDLNNVYSTFKEYLCKNQKLDNDLRPLKQSSYFSEPLVIKRIIVYSFKDGLLTEYQYDYTSKTFSTILSNYSGSVKTPTGRDVTKTSIYTEVGFTLNLFGTPFTDKTIVSYTDVVN